MAEMTRREFLSRSGISLAGVAGSVALSALSSRHVLGANERVRAALIGCGGRGRYVARGMIEEGAELVWLCDLHEERILESAEFLSDVQEKKPGTTKKMSDVLDDKSLDAVIVGTPDHWHAPAAILACQAGKDVYVEKPHTRTVWETRKVIEAARKYDRVVQVGTQNRSGEYNLAGREKVRSGTLGDIRLVKVYNLKSGGPFFMGKSKPRPDGFDWDAWLGVAPDRPYHERIFHGGWHHFWDFSGGDLCDDAAHQVDLALMYMDDPGVPKSVSSSGGRIHHKQDHSEVPDLLVTTFEFDDFVYTLEHSNYPRYMRKTTGTIRRNDEFPYWTQNATRIELYGSEHMMTIGRHGGGWQITMSGGKVVEQMYGRTCDNEHYRNFLGCVKSRERPNADVEVLQPSCMMLHMASISHRVGNEKLWFDGKDERFKENSDANQLVKGTQRKAYAIPEKV